MKGLKVVLWINAVVFMLGFLGLFLTWPIISGIFAYFNIDISEFHGPLKYGFRIALFGYGLIGIFFLMLARDPFKYGAMLSLGGYGLIACALFCLAWGYYYNTSWWYWIIDALYGFIFGGLILYFKGKAQEAG